MSGSLWDDALPADERVSGPPLDGDASVDVAIVGGGLTGLWTAWHLLRADPHLHVAVVEAEHVGFGASGRNGGWASALLPMSLGRIAHDHGRDAAIGLQRAMHDTVSAIATFAGPAVAHRGGTVSVGRGRPQMERLVAEAEEYHRFGFDEYRIVGRDEADGRCRIAGTVGALVTPHCAAVQPMRLTYAVAGEVRRLGGTIHEHTRATDVTAGRVVTDRGTVSAEVVVLATEGYTPGLPGRRRDLVPIYSLMIATEPLPDDMWDEIGLADRPTFDDRRHVLIYGQRTADGRLAFGGRGAPYHFGSAIRPGFDTDPAIHRKLVDSLHELFPVTRNAEITHRWGGVLGAPRDWHCSVIRRGGLATIGGYVGDGVTTTYLAARSLAALIVPGSDDPAIARLPWVGHRSPRWEPEPLRWLGINAARRAASLADRHEERTGTTSRLWGGIVDRLLKR